MTYYGKFPRVEGLFIEVECGGSDAAGGGCGAPLQFYSLERKAWNDAQGLVRDEPSNFNVWEIGFTPIGPVKLQFSPCSECSQYS